MNIEWLTVLLFGSFFILLALGLPHQQAHGSLRFSLGKWTTEADIDQVLEVLPRIVARLRAMSPLLKGRG